MFRLWRRIKILPGVRLNLSKSGVSVSLGARGANFTIGPRGTRATVGIPGSGMFYTKHKSWKKTEAQKINLKRERIKRQIAKLQERLRYLDDAS